MFDAAKWNFDPYSISFLHANHPKLDLQNISFAETKRIIGNTSRLLATFRKLLNSDKKKKKIEIEFYISRSKMRYFVFDV